MLRLAVLEAVFFCREPQALFWTIAFPTFVLVLFGHVFGQSGYVEFLVPGLVGMNLISVAFFSTGAVMVGYRERGVLRRLRATPLRPAAFIGAQFANRMLISVVQTTALMTLAYLIFDVRPKGNVLALGAVVIVGLATFMSLGLAIASISTTLSDSERRILLKADGEFQPAGARGPE